MFTDVQGGCLMVDQERATLPRIVTSIPGLKSKQMIERYRTHFGERGSPTIAIDKAYGCIKEDVDGNRFLDFAQSLCVTGYSNPDVIEASTEQMRRIIPREKGSPTLLGFTELLLSKLPGELRDGRVNFVVSGSEAVELAVQLARAYTERPLILSYIDSHHGHVGTVFELSGEPSIDVWKAKISDIVHIPYPTCYRCPFKREHPGCDLHCLEYIKNLFETVALPDQIAGLLMEPVLLNGGVYIPPDEYMRGIINFCGENGVQFIADEVYSGLGVTGEFLAVDHWRITPDILCLGKAMGGGYPVAAVATKREITDGTRGGVVFTGTFAGNLVGCAAGTATLEYIKKSDLMSNARDLGGYLLRSLGELSERKESIGDIRGKGLIIGVELVKDIGTKEPASEEASSVIGRALENGLLLRKYGRYRNVLIMTPPLTLSREQADAALEILEKVVK
jgi:4-aminobutyrate aminotransferase-like enzyme